MTQKKKNERVHGIMQTPVSMKLRCLRIHIIILAVLNGIQGHGLDRTQKLGVSRSSSSINNPEVTLISAYILSLIQCLYHSANCTLDSSLKSTNQNFSPQNSNNDTSVIGKFTERFSSVKDAIHLLDAMESSPDFKVGKSSGNFVASLKNQEFRSPRTRPLSGRRFGCELGPLPIYRRSHNLQLGPHKLGRG